MPDNRQDHSNVVSTTSSNGSAEKLEEAMWSLKIQNQDDQNGGAAHSNPHSDRPGEPDCIYYLRTGVCGYGSNCRFNHPSYSGQTAQNIGELPERVGQPDCQYFLKTGTCKFGSTCKYHHPHNRNNGQVILNILGLPMRQEEKPCLYYMRNGSCKFGVACKFHHPQPLGALLPVSGTTAYGSSGSSVAPPSSMPYSGGFQTWSIPRAPYIPGPPHMQGPQAYVPIVLPPSQGILPAQQGWNTYPGIVGSVSPNNVLGSNLLYNTKSQGELGSGEQVQWVPPSIPHFPERPDQPECQYYMKNGSCKFGSSCKYHHPKDRIAPAATSSLSPFGLPLRPGQAICTFYSMYGICKFGSTCKFDHPLAGFYHYGMSIPAPPMPDPHLYPYQRNSPVTHPSETSLSKPSRLPDRTKKHVATRAKNQHLDIKVPKDPVEQPPSSANTTPTSPEP